MTKFKLDLAEDVNISKKTFLDFIASNHPEYNTRLPSIMSFIEYILEDINILDLDYTSINPKIETEIEGCIRGHLKTDGENKKRIYYNTNTHFDNSDKYFLNNLASIR